MLMITVAVGMRATGAACGFGWEEGAPRDGLETFCVGALLVLCIDDFEGIQTMAGSIADEDLGASLTCKSLISAPRKTINS